jgi:hypothetical protein
MSERGPLAEFSGRVRVLRAPGSPLGLTLTGASAVPPGDAMQLAFAGSAPAEPELPEALDGARIEQGPPGTFDIVSGTRSFRIAAPGVHVHHDVGREFYAAIPGRAVPLMRRLLLAAALAIASSRAGLTLLRLWRG